MKMKTSMTCAALALMLAGCSQSAPPPEGNGAAAIRIENPGSDQLKALSPLNQRITLARAIRDNGKRCRNVATLGYQQEYQSMAMWVALCSDGHHWAIYIAPNGDTQVRDCGEAAQLNLPHCRPVAPLPHDPNAPPNTEPNANVVEQLNANLINAQ
jgi:hypothetical protein